MIRRHVPDVLDARLDAYGKHGRAGALADWVEACAIKGVHRTQAALADLIVDLNWTSKPLRQIRLEPDEADPENWPLQAFGLLRERADILGDRYPFAFRFGGLQLRPGVDPLTTPYIGLLCITLAHAWDIACPNDPEAVLEGVVARALEGRSLTVAPAGTADRAGLGFADNLQRVGAALGLAPMQNPVPVSRFAKDAGVDTIAGLPWFDNRPGQWLWIGQVTCAATENWKVKFVEPKPELWSDYLNEVLRPSRFLAVPHHAERAWMAMLLKGDQGTILDRLRLTAGLDSVDEDSAAIIEAVLALPVE